MHFRRGDARRLPALILLEAFQRLLRAILNLLCALFAWFIQGSGSNGLLLLGIAVFFVALGLLADAIVDGLSTLAGSLWSVVRG